MVVKLKGAAQKARQGQVTPAINKLGAYLNEFEAIVPDATVVPEWLIATDVRDNLILNGLVPPPN